MAIVNTNFYSPITSIGFLNLQQTDNAISRSVQKLSSGSRLVNSSEDPSGKILANKFKAQVSGMSTATGNAQDAISLLQVADSALNELSDNLLRMRDLALKTMNQVTLTAADVATMQTEFASLRDDITNKANATTFNNVTLLDGTLVPGLVAHVGPDAGTQYQLTITIQTMVASSIANATTDLANVQLTSDGINSAAGHADSALQAISASMTYLSQVQTAVATQQIRMNGAINILSAEEVNTSAALSRVSDVDMASEISYFVKLQIIAQAGTAVVANGDTASQRIVKLLDSLHN